MLYIRYGVLPGGASSYRGSGFAKDKVIDAHDRFTVYIYLLEVAHTVAQAQALAQVPAQVLAQVLAHTVAQVQVPIPVPIPVPAEAQAQAQAQSLVPEPGQGPSWVASGAEREAPLPQAARTLPSYC